ncbi:insulinase family protein [Akkermansiaceae bacterium]|nr:insulinase family protein [Akkermansiaceae bacterium]
MNFPATTASLHTLQPEFDTILDPIENSPVISAQIWVETGSQHESALAGSGISHLLEHMVFKGTDRFTGEALSQEVQAAGGQWNAYTSFDRTVYYIDGPARSLELFLSALIEMVFRPTFPEDEYEREKEVIRREIAMGLDDPDSVSSQLLFRTAYQRDNRRHPVIGHLDLFNAITYEQMKTYHAARYRPENSFLVLSGGFDPIEARQIIESELAKGLRPPAEFPVALPPEPRQIGTRRAGKSFAVPTTHLSLTWQIPDLTHKDAPALDLLSVILGGGRASPLYRVIREEKGMAHSVGAYAWMPADGPGLFSAYAEADSEKIPEIEKEILNQIKLLGGVDLTKPTARALRQIASSQFKTLTTASGRASDLGSNWHSARDLDFTKNAVARLGKVTEGDLRRALTKWLVPETLSVTTLEPANAALPVVASSTKKDSEEILEHTLANGLRVVLQRDTKVPVVYSQTALLAGRLSESPENAGLNQLLASLLLKGTTRRDALSIAETLEDLGASIRPSSGNNSFMLSSYCLRDDLPQVIDLLAEIISEPSFPGDSIERERAAMVAGLEESLEDPANRAFREMRFHLWSGQGYGVPSSGTHESLASLNRLALSAQHSRYFVAENMVTAFFGDLDPDRTIIQLENTLGKIPVGSPVDLTSPNCAAHGEHSFKLDKEQAVLAIGYPGVAANDPRRFALELLDSYCSDMAGPLFTRIREELGLAYYVSSSMFLGLDTGLMSFYLGTSPGQLELARKELTKEIEKLVSGGIPSDALERVKANTEAREALRNQNPSNRARMAALDVLLGQEANQHLQLSERLNAVTGEEVHALAKELFQDDKSMIVTVSP